MYVQHGDRIESEYTRDPHYVPMPAVAGIIFKVILQYEADKIPIQSNESIKSELHHNYNY